MVIMQSIFEYSDNIQVYTEYVEGQEYYDGVKA